MQDPLDALEDRMTELRGAIRGALAVRDQERARDLRAELRRAERAWDALVALPGEPEEERQGSAAALPAREQVHQALGLLGVPAAPKLIRAVHSAFFGTPIVPAGLVTLRRDEERSYRSAPAARPYYLCPALTAGPLSPARALVCISTWPLEQRIICQMSPHVDYLTAAVRVAGAASAPGKAGAGPEAESLLRRFAANIPGAGPGLPDGTVSPAAVIAAAEAGLALFAGRDRDDRAQEAQRARDRLGDAGQLFGVRPAAGQDD